MIDYSESLLAIAENHKTITKLLLDRNTKSSVDEINNLIINAIDLKQWISKNAHKFD
jgi:hypothetical protein